jgi:hypothetical protein
LAIFIAARAKANKNLQQHHQVHDQEDAIDPCFAGTCCFGPDVIQFIAVFALPELTFNWYTLPIIFTPLLL